MTVEENRGSEIDRFPVGMRVLAVDDDPTCLKLLDALLSKCQYQVTTTSQAITALKMLRENSNRFDLVISDVHMPDMDGFKLLELVGLEMDLPVIMLSGNSDPKLVMKGITHGACDYLVKPVRLEELKNIWQHVIRRKKFDSKSQAKSINQERSNPGGDGGQELANGDQNGKLNRKRKDEDEEGEDNGHENDDPSTQKKPRVVWSIDLHRKFVAAVNHLSIEKAVPKRILDLMNVEGLTRENVASHLQKYRLYLKRISLQQANMVVTFGGKDASYVRMGSIDGFGDFRTLTGSGRLQNTALSSYPPSGMLGRLNSANGMSLHSLTSPSLISPSHGTSLSNSTTSLGKFQPVIPSTTPNTNSFTGIQSSFELDHKSTNRIGEFNSIDDPGTYIAGSSTNPPSTSPANAMILQGNPQTGLVFTNQSSLKVASTCSESFNVGSSGSTFLDQNRCNENWHSAIQPSKFPSNPLPLGENYHDQLPLTSMRYNGCTLGHVQNSLNGFASNATISGPLEDLTGACPGGFVDDIVPNIDQSSGQTRGQYKQDYAQFSNNAFSTLASLEPANGSSPLTQTKDQNDIVYGRTDVSLVGRSNDGASSRLQGRDTEKSNMAMKMRSNGDYITEQTKPTGGFIANGYDSLDYLMNAMMKREQDTTILMDGEYGINAYSYGSCL